jgi:ribosomal protein L7/L12
MLNLRPDQVQKIHRYIHDQQLINAIKLYREATGTSLAEAKLAIEEMARDEFTKPSSEMRMGNEPIMDNKIRSLLAQRKKIDAVKIYREEHGIGLKEAKDYVDQIEYSMRRENLPGSMPYESAISGNPFDDTEDDKRRRAVLMAAIVAVLMLGLGILFVFLVR